MSTFEGSYEDVCNVCRLHAGLHEGDALVCPRSGSQPLSRVVAGPDPIALSEADLDALRLCSRHENGPSLNMNAWSADVDAFEKRHAVPFHEVLEQLQGQGLIDDDLDLTATGNAALGVSDAAPASSLIADVAAFRALTPEQRAALLAIGADGPALLEAARACVQPPGHRLYVSRDRLADALARIDARRSLMNLDVVVPGHAMNRLRAAVGAADQFGWGHGEDCPHYGCEDDCVDGEDCDDAAHACGCGIAEVEELIAAAKAVCS